MLITRSQTPFAIGQRGGSSAHATRGCRRSGPVPARRYCHGHGSETRIAWMSTPDCRRHLGSGADDGKPNTVDGRLVMVADLFRALFSPHGVQPHLSARPDPRSFRRVCRLCRSSIHRTSSGVSTPSVSRLNTRPFWPPQFTTAVATAERDLQSENPSTANSSSRESSTTRGYRSRQFSDSPFTQWDVWDFSSDQSGQRLYRSSL